MLVGHEVRTTEAMGWQDESNGRLLALAATEFDVFVTVDRGVARQQNLGELPIPVIIMRCRSNSIRVIERHTPSVISLLAQGLQRRVYVLEEPPDPRRRG